MHVPVCRLISFHFLWAIHPFHPVLWQNFCFDVHLHKLVNNLGGHSVLLGNFCPILVSYFWRILKCSRLRLRIWRRAGDGDGESPPGLIEESSLAVLRWVKTLKRGNAVFRNGLVGKPKQFRFGFGRKFRTVWVWVSVFRFSPFSVFRPKQPVSAEIPYFGRFWMHISV